jgi:hypothetical protein
MRQNHPRFCFLVASGLLVMLSGCGGIAEPALDLPVCPDGDLLTTAPTGELLCVSPAMEPLCTKTQVLTSDEQGLRCTDLNALDGPAFAERLAQLRFQVVDHSLARDRYLGRGATFVGLSERTYYGRLMESGDDNGIAGGARLCGLQYGLGAHVCTVYEMYNSVAAGLINENTSIARGWLYFPAGNAQPSAYEIDAGQADTCASFTNTLSSNGHRGVLLEWAPLPTGPRGFLYHGGNSARCANPFPLLCCR